MSGEFIIVSCMHVVVFCVQFVAACLHSLQLCAVAHCTVAHQVLIWMVP